MTDVDLKPQSFLQERLGSCNIVLLFMFANNAKPFSSFNRFTLLSKLLWLVSVSSLKQLVGLWTERYPDPKVDPLNLWDNIITSR